MHLPFFHLHNDQLESSPDQHPVVHTEPAHNTSEGSEFLDDAIRMHEQPLMYTEVSVSAGGPVDLL
ncbi:hypothetical protein HHL16_10485 [Pseudoflavitalea sp. G-6-1-2]|uniref:hypothetical protein n=1 Tax=Pseudoflavitalea sp. G-6-1-2 TaxID=2728841 RepID=UPI00146C2925|nr:hypothetical protein [Pseudoflavitalea sp. G-6-1-2]NML21302.1 hypothetical protein [Pseudoflavitalea sp. G-6-1-2]